MKKRILSMLLAIVMVVGLVPGVAVTASAADNTTVEQLQAAINAGGTVKLGGDIDLVSTKLTFPDNTPVTIDLNSHTLSKSQSGYVLELDAGDDVTITGEGTVSKAGGWYFFKNDSGYLKIEGGTYEKSGYDLVYMKGSSETEITGGTFVLDNIFARQSDKSTGTIRNGQFTVNTVSTGLWTEGITITGGTFSIDPTQYGVDTGSYSVTKNADNTYTVAEKPATYTVTAAAAPAEGGTVAGGGTYDEGASVTVTATPATGYKFVRWTENGSDISTSATYTFTAEANRTLAAVFEEVQLITLNLESPRGLKETIEIDLSATVAGLKAAVAAKCNVTFGGSSEYRLFGEDLSYPNSKLDDDTKVLKDIGFANGQTIHLEKSTNWQATDNEPIKIFGLTITGGKGSQEPYGDWGNVDYYWNYYYKTITIKSTAKITISGTGEHNTNIIIKKAGSSKYTNLTISDLHLTNDDSACINVQGNSWVKLTVKGNNTLTTSPGEDAELTVSQTPALTLTNSGAYLKIMKASTGTLTATTNFAGQPGIGTYDNISSVWGVEINGGTIIANGGEGAAGIRAQTVCIYGGNVTANGGIDGYGSNSHPYSIEILGGTVTASSEAGKALTTAPNLDSYKYYTATASTNKDGTDAVAYDSEANDTYKFFKIEPRTDFIVGIGSAIENGTVVADKATAKENETVTLTVTPKDGYTLDNLKYNDGTSDTAIEGTTFAMPAADVIVTATFKPVQPITFDTTDRTATYGDGALDARTATAAGTITYSSSDETVATVDENGIVTVLKAGETTITASAAETDTYAASSASYKLTVAPKSLNITVADKSAYVGSQKPELSAADATVSGLVGSDNVTVTLSYVTEPDMSKAGEYEITAAVTDESGNYAVTVVKGKLKVSYAPVYDPAYPPIVEDTTGGDISVSDQYPEQGDKVTITTEPDKGYEVGEITVTDRNGNPVEVIDNGDGTYTYVQPVGKVTISVIYVCNGTHNCPSLAYSDLDVNAWCHEAADYVLSKGLMNGIGNGKFDPNGTASRAMMVTILWRMEGQPVVNCLMQFEDIAPESWYAEAVRWAASEGIVTGYSDIALGPNDPITREQLATILYRYEQYKGGGFTGAWMFLLDYTDREKISEWAYEAICWTTMHGVINGKGDGILDPKGNATRCEAAQMLMNYLNK